MLEISGPPVCKDTEFQCRDGRCLDPALKCDLIVDCKQGEDEANCGKLI